MKIQMLEKYIPGRFGRFLIAGFCNTVVNFAVLNVAYYKLHQSKIMSVLIATSFAIAFSYFINRTFVFRDERHTAKKFIRFTFFAFSGVMLIQNVVYAFTVTILDSHKLFVRSFTNSNLLSMHLSNSFVVINLSNIIASLCVMLWNYNCYRLFVFKDKYFTKVTNSKNEEINLESN